MPEVPRNWTSGFLFLIVINSKYPFYKIFFCCHDILFCCKGIEKRHFLQMRQALQGMLLCVSRFNFQIVKQNSLFAKGVIGEFYWTQ